MPQAPAADSPALEAPSTAGLPAWLAGRKRADHATLLDLPMPDSRSMEDWRRTDVSHVRLENHDFGASAPADDASGAGWRRSGEGGALVLQHGVDAMVANLPAALAAQGVIVTTLDEAARSHAELVERRLGSAIPASAGKFAALNAALWRGGVFVHVPRGVQAALPIWYTAAMPAAGGDRHAAILPRSLVIIDEGASLVYTDEYASTSGAGEALSSAITEVILGDGATIQYLVLQQWADDVDHFAHHRIHVGRGSRAELVVAASGARTSKVYMDVAMLGEGSTARISGLVIGDGKQHFDYQSLQDHHAPHCTSDLLVKGALRDAAVSVYSGLIKIRKEAQHSDAYQANRNLLLSHDARADSIPKLEIEANDVRCTHGATVGQVDPEQVFYLQARGVPTKEAQNLVVHGFFQPVIDRIALPAVREQIHEAIDRELVGVEPLSK